MNRIVIPKDIETRSFEIIEQITKKIKGNIPFSRDEWMVVRRIIHSTADFDVLNNIRFHPLALESGISAIRGGSTIVTDTNMARSGISKWRLNRFNVDVQCLVGDEEVAREAKVKGCTRSMVAIEHAISLGDNLVFGIGNAPTALFHLLDLMDRGKVRPALIIGMVVGFVGAEESKEELIKRSPVPYIVLRGKKGGSPLISATINALLDLAGDSIYGK